MLSHCIKSIECSKMFAEAKTFKDAKDNEINWLKNRFKFLRPSWKPSEEQIRSLEYFIELWGDSDGQLKYAKIFNDVKTLCEQLKSL